MNIPYYPAIYGKYALTDFDGCVTASMDAVDELIDGINRAGGRECMNILVTCNDNLWNLVS